MIDNIVLGYIKDKNEANHESSMVKQIIYNMITLTAYLGWVNLCTVKPMVTLILMCNAPIWGSGILTFYFKIDHLHLGDHSHEDEHWWNYCHGGCPWICPSCFCWCPQRCPGSCLVSLPWSNPPQPLVLQTPSCHARDVTNKWWKAPNSCLWNCLEHQEMFMWNFWQWRYLVFLKYLLLLILKLLHICSWGWREHWDCGGYYWQWNRRWHINVFILE